MAKNSFVLYYEYKEHFDLLSDEELGKLMRAIMVYEAEGVVPELDGMVKMAFSFIRKDLDISREKYDAKCERNRQNGKNGGRGNKTESECENEKPKKSERFSAKPKKSERFFEKPKKADNDSDSERDSDNESDSGSGGIYITAAATDDLVSLYEENIGKATAYVTTRIREWLSKVDASLIEYAIEQAASCNVRKWAYINRILESQYTEGRLTREDAEDENKYRRKCIAEEDVVDDVLFADYGT